MTVLPNREQLPADILHSTRAVLWNYIVKVEGQKPSKVPFQPHRPSVPLPSMTPARGTRSRWRMTPLGR